MKKFIKTLGLTFAAAVLVSPVVFAEDIPEKMSPEQLVESAKIELSRVEAVGQPLTADEKPALTPAGDTAEQAKGEPAVAENKPALTPAGDTADKAKGEGVTAEKPTVDVEAFKKEVEAKKLEAAKTPTGKKVLPKTSAVK